MTALKGILKLAPFILAVDDFAAAMIVMRFRNGYGAKRPHQGIIPLDALRGKNRETDAVMNRLRGRSVAEDISGRQFHQARGHVDGGAHKAVFAALVAAIFPAKQPAGCNADRGLHAGSPELSGYRQGSFDASLRIVFMSQPRKTKGKRHAEALVIHDGLVNKTVEPVGGALNFENRGLKGIEKGIPEGEANQIDIRDGDVAKFRQPLPLAKSQVIDDDRRNERLHLQVRCILPGELR
ncbi:MAG: hypothetical protein ACLQDM_08700 [Bradyrhizobium sp.]